MDWFRWKSMPHDTAGASFEKPVSAPKTDFDRQSTAERRVQDDAPAPHVVVTNDSHPQTRSQSKGPLNIPDQSSPKAAEPSTAALKAVDLQRDASMASARTATSAGTSQEQHQTQAKVQEPFNDNKLRFHQGAVDQNALTSRSPPHVLLDLRKTLFALGIEAREEGGSAFRLKCIRPSSKKTAAAYGMSVAALYGQANSRDAPNPGLGFTRQASGRVVNSSLTASPSSTFKSLFTRRGSSHSQMGPSSPALSQSSVSEAHGTPDLLLSPLAASTSSLGQNGSLPLPFYGGKDDPGAEVRFTVEISRMKGLPDLYAIDIRRLKGSLWSYRAVRPTSPCAHRLANQAFCRSTMRLSPKRP